MFRIVYLDENFEVSHKGGFNGIKEAMNWIDSNNEYRFLKLLVWNDYLDCFSTVLIG